MITPLKKAFTRLATDIEVIRPALDERIRNDKTLGSQKPVLQEVDSRLMDLHDQLISILTIWNITDAKNQENEAVLTRGMDKLADDATLIGGAEVFIREPSGIKDVLMNSSERNAKIAINLIPDQAREIARKKWCEWWGCND